MEMFSIVTFETIPKIPRPAKTPGTQGEVLLLRKWANEYGKATTLLSVRAKSTKDNPGMLPISAYGRRTLGNNPLMSLDEMCHNVFWEEDALAVGEEVEGEEEEDSFINENFDGGSSGDTNEAESDLVFMKDSVVLILQDDRVSGPFLLGRPT